MTPVIMAGGSGTRLWPLSRSAYPKQFLCLGDDKTMLQKTVERLEGLTSEKPIIITNEKNRFLVAEQLRQIDKDATILLEPDGRNTAPAIALSAFEAINQAQDKNPVLLILAADHLIDNTTAFHSAVQKLFDPVCEGKFGTLGIKPTEPSTGYGYIKVKNTNLDTHISFVEKFVEKPSKQKASEYISSGNYLWNSGMFLIRADRYLEKLEKYNKEIFSACKSAMKSAEKDLDFIRVDEDAFLKSPDDSIDYAVMEPLSKEKEEVVVVSLDAGWNDIGSWASLWDVSRKTQEGNVVFLSQLDKEDTPILHNTKNTLINTSDRLITTLGVTDLIIVDTKDALLVANKNDVQDIKKIISKIKQQGSKKYEFHREVYRPWGKYDSIDNGERYQVKRITVKPGAKLSVQMHHHRAEHWIVVSGTAKVTNGDKTFLVTENESTYIPIGQVHALENPGKVKLEMIEVQSGSYLDEDDIVRISDKYGRT